MEENILGKNIEYLRKNYGETLDELGYVIGFERNTVKGYENGSRTPKPETISKIARYYNTTVDEIMNVKLYESPALNPQKRIYYTEISNEFLSILPLVESTTACENEFFLEGMKLLKKMLKNLNAGECVKGSVIDEVMDCYSKAADEVVIEAVANSLWCIYFLWNQQYSDFNSIKAYNKRLISNQVDMKEMMYEQRKINKKSAKKRAEFINDLDEVINDGIKILKENEEWAALGDYYLALRYVVGMVDTGLPDAMNTKIGAQMMLAFAGVGNQYALTFFRTGIKLG